MEIYFRLWTGSRKKENGQESIFEIQYKRNTPGVSGSNYNGYYRPPFVNINGWVGYGDDPVTRNHYECYEEGDLRRGCKMCVFYTKEEYPNMSSNYEFPCYVNKISGSFAVGRKISRRRKIIIRYCVIRTSI